MSRGRPKGSPNKRSSIIERMLEHKGADPLGFMADLILDEDADRQLRFNAAKELAQYVAPKRKAIELTGEGSRPVTLRVVYDS